MGRGSESAVLCLFEYAKRVNSSEFLIRITRRHGRRCKSSTNRSACKSSEWWSPKRAATGAMRAFMLGHSTG